MGSLRHSTTEEREIGDSEILSRSSDTVTVTTRSSGVPFLQVTTRSSASCIPTWFTAIPIPNHSYPSQLRLRTKQKSSRKREIPEREAQTRMCFFQFQL